MNDDLLSDESTQDRDAATAPLRDCGVVYTAMGDTYRAEAVEAARQVKTVMPDLAICLFTDAADFAHPVFDRIEVREARRPPMFFKQWMRDSPYEKTLYLDTDTLVVERLDSLFALLDRFDVAALPLAKPITIPVPEIDACFPEYNAGVIAFRRGDRVTDLFDRWEANFLRQHAENGLGNDQPGFRLALYESEVRLAPLRHEDNFLLYFPTAAGERVRIVHGRPPERARAVARDVNARLGRRAHVPRLGVLRAAHEMTWREKLTLARRALGSLVSRIWARFGSRPSPPSERG